MMNKRLIGTVVCLVVILLTTLGFSQEALAQQQGASNPAMGPLVRVLHAKGIITDEEMAQISQASSSGEADQRLAKLLLSKGVISQADYDQTFGVATISVSTTATSTDRGAIPARPCSGRSSGADYLQRGTRGTQSRRLGFGYSKRV